MNTFKGFFCFLFLFSIIPVSTSLAENHTISATVEITETAINRYINNQYNAVGFPRSFNITYDGIDYTIALGLPSVVLTQGHAAIQLAFDVNSGTDQLYHFSVEPGLDIPSIQITEPELQAGLIGLTAALNNISIPQWLRDAVYQNYNPVKFTMYPSRLIDQVNTTWFSTRTIVLTDPYYSLMAQVLEHAINFNISTYLHSDVPKIDIWVGDPISGNDHVLFKPNFEVEVKEIIIVPFGEETTEYHGYPYTICYKNDITWIDIGTLNLGPLTPHIVRVVYTTSNTWYCGEYLVNVNDGNPDGSMHFVNPINKENF